MRQVSLLDAAGARQMHILTTRRDLPVGQIRYRMGSRWRQENHYRYARIHFDFDSHDSYRTRGDDPTRSVPNPAKKTAYAQVENARRAMHSAQTQRDRDLLAVSSPQPGTSVLLTNQAFNTINAEVHTAERALDTAIDAHQAKLRSVIEALRAEVAELLRQLGQHSQNSSKPPSSDSPFAKPAPKSLRRRSGPRRCLILSSARSASWTRAEKTPRSVRAMASRRSAWVRPCHSMGSENSEFSKKPSPRVNRVTCGDITVIAEHRWWNTSLRMDAVDSPPPMTATRAAAIRSPPAARRQNSAIDHTRGSPGSTERPGCPGPVIITASADRLDPGMRTVQRDSFTEIWTTSPPTTFRPAAAATQPKYLAHVSCVGAESVPVDPTRELAGGDHEGLPAVPRQPLVEFGIAARHQRGSVREPDVLLGAGTQPLPAVGPPARGLPVGRHTRAFDRDNGRNLNTHLAQCRAFAATAAAFAPAPTIARVRLISQPQLALPRGRPPQLTAQSTQA
jgi:hypothetical protein